MYATKNNNQTFKNFLFNTFSDLSTRVITKDEGYEQYVEQWSLDTLAKIAILRYNVDAIYIALDNDEILQQIRSKIETAETYEQALFYLVHLVASHSIWVLDNGMELHTKLITKAHKGLRRKTKMQIFENYIKYARPYN